MIQSLPIAQIIFYGTAIALVVSALLVIISSHPVRSALFLVLAFFCSSVLWMLLQAEFLSLVLIFVYVGAVMTLFLFVVMMINLDFVTLKEGLVRYLPYAFVIMILFVGIMWVVLTLPHSDFTQAVLTVHSSHYNNTLQLGELLYSKYLYAFELTGMILLVAIVSAIILAFHGHKSDSKVQNIARQVNVTKEQRLKIIKMKAES